MNDEFVAVDAGLVELLQRELNAFTEYRLHPVDVGLLDADQFAAAGDINDLYDLTMLNAILKKQGLPEVSS